MGAHMDIRRFLGELKGRGVYRVAAIYAAGSWALLQVGDIFFPILGFPDWAITGVLAVAALGFPVAIILAWVFEITSEGIVEIDPEVNFGKLRLSPARLAELGLLLALIFLVGFLYLERLTLQEKVAEAFGGNQDERPSVAVMAFQNMSDDPSAEYFGDGLAEEILNLLARFSELNVAARTSSFYFKGKNVDLREVGQKLGVNHVLEGSVRRAGDRVRITAQLIAMDTGYHVWSETFDRDYSDSFQIQEEIARQVVGTMQVILSDASREILQTTKDVDPAAYDYYLRGREYLRLAAGDQNLDRALELFQKAVDLDPDYAEAHAGVCDAYLALYRSQVDAEYFRLAESSCSSAVALDDSALPVYIALGNLYRLSGRYDESEAQLARALAINARSVPALKALAMTLHASNRTAEAEATLQKAIGIQPNNWHSYFAMGNLFFESGRFAEAIPYYRRTTELIPDHASAHNNLGAAHYMLSQFDEAAAAWERSLAIEPTPNAYSNAGSSLYFLGRFEEAVSMYHKAVELAPEDFVSWGNLGDAYRYTEELADLSEPMYRNAIKLASSHLQINPSDAVTAVLVAHYHASVGDREEALEYHARALALAPEDVTVHYMSAILLSTLEEHERALASLRHAIELGYSMDLIYADAGLAALREDLGFQDVISVLSE